MEGDGAVVQDAVASTVVETCIVPLRSLNGSSVAHPPGWSNKRAIRPCGSPAYMDTVADIAVDEFVFSDTLACSM